MSPDTDAALPPLNILVVDDDANIRKTLAYCLAAEGHEVIAVGSKDDALAESRLRVFDMAFVDLRLGEDDGMELVSVFSAESPWTKIVIITAHASIGSAVEAMRRGAEDYIDKPFTPEQIRLMTRRIGRIRKLENEIAVLSESVQRFEPEGQLLSRNPAMQTVIETAKKAAASEAIILLRGESGTGKSVFARAVHRWSPRSGKPMAVVSCPSLPEQLLESELFGHVKGAFTGAVKDNPGRIAACEGGTLFLDEIGDMALPVQAKLLRFIQDKEYERLGDAKPRRADVRIIAASNADLEKRVAEGAFREDLYYRLNVISLIIPPLRERPEDIVPMARSLLAFFNRTNHKTILDFDEELEAALVQYPWPGNVRELRNAIERAVILGNGPTIGKQDLSPAVSAAVVSAAPASPKLGDPVPLQAIEELHIRRVLAKTPSLKEAADILGIDQATLWRKRKMYGQ